MHSSRIRTVRSSGRISGGGGLSAPGGWGRCLIQGVGCLLRGGMSAPRGVSAPGGCLVWGVSGLGGVCPWGDVCSRGVSAPRGVSALGEVSAPGGGVVSQHALRQTPPPPCGQTDACKNITFATSLRTLINLLTLKTSSYDRTCKTGPRGPSSSC